MAENYKAVSFRFNMNDDEDVRLYNRLMAASSGSSSMSAFIKQSLNKMLDREQDENNILCLKNDLYSRQEYFFDRIENIVAQEAEKQVLKMVGCIVSGMSTGAVVGHSEAMKSPSKDNENDDLSDELVE